MSLAPQEQLTLKSARDHLRLAATATKAPQIRPFLEAAAFNCELALSEPAQVDRFLQHNPDCLGMLEHMQQAFALRPEGIAGRTAIYPHESGLKEALDTIAEVNALPGVQALRTRISALETQKATGMGR